MAHEVGFRVHVIDDREKFANTERFGDGIDVVVENIPTWLARHPLPPTAYAVIVTRGHTHDLDALRALAAAAPLSRPDWQQGQGAAHLRRAAGGGRLAESLEGVHAPIGLDIGAITPQEIAVSIVAELIAAKHGKTNEPNVAAVSMRWEGALRK